MTVPGDALQILAAHKQRQDAERAYAEAVWEASDVMFTDEVGGVVTPVAFNHHWTRM